MKKCLNVFSIDDCPGMYYVDGFQEEFEKAVSEKKENGQYHKWLRRCLNRIQEFGKEVLKLEGFEKLITKKNEPNLYALRYPHSKKNPRVIYFYADCDKVCLLHAFLENSKKSGKEYEAAIDIALNRLRQIEIL